MSTIGPVKVFSVTIAAQGTTAAVASDAIDLGGGYSHINLVIPSMTSGVDIQFLVSETASGTFRKLYYPPTTTSAPAAVNIISSITNCCVGIPCGFQFFKIYLTTAATAAGQTFSIIATAN